jgi:endonuclease VIII-like 1
MPEGPEVKIMSDFINRHSKGRVFNCLNHVDKNNSVINPIIVEEFKLSADTNGKELILNLQSNNQTKKLWVFMGMSGNWKFVLTDDWIKSKYIRLRIDSTDGHSLILYGGFMGPKYSLEPFKSKRGPDPTKNFEDFKENIYKNIHKKSFDRPICEGLLDQRYFNGIGNYLRSTILYYLDINPFMSTREAIKNHPQILDMCQQIPNKAYQLNGGQLRDWQNPFDTDKQQFIDWVFYQKGSYCTDKSGRTFWFNPKWNSFCLYKYKTKENLG